MNLAFLVFYILLDSVTEEFMYSWNVHGKNTFEPCQRTLSSSSYGPFLGALHFEVMC